MSVDQEFVPVVRTRSLVQDPTRRPKPQPKWKIGDAPAHRVVSFEVSAGPITATPTSGNAVTVLSGTRRLELSHLSGTNEPLPLLNVPQGSYSSASITVYWWNCNLLNQAITLNFSPALTIGASAMVVDIDLNVADSLMLDGQGNVTGVNFTAASFTVGTAVVPAEDKQGHDDGELEDTTGVIMAVSGTPFTLTVDQTGVPLSFTTGPNTQFNDGATLTLNTIVTVEGLPSVARHVAFFQPLLQLLSLGLRLQPETVIPFWAVS